MENSKKIVIVGGGFGGIRAVLDLAKKQLPNAKIILISNKSCFEYQAALYRIVTGRSPLEACVPLREIFIGKNFETLEDTIIKIDFKEHIKPSEGDETFLKEMKIVFNSIKYRWNYQDFYIIVSGYFKYRPSDNIQGGYDSVQATK